jgi:hypothetical protein
METPAIRSARDGEHPGDEDYGEKRHGTTSPAHESPKNRAGWQAARLPVWSSLAACGKRPPCHDEATSGKVFPLDRLPACLRLSPFRAFLSGSSVLCVFTFKMRPMIVSVPPFQEN